MRAARKIGRLTSQPATGQVVATGIQSVASVMELALHNAGREFVTVILADRSRRYEYVLLARFQ